MNKVFYTILSVILLLIVSCTNHKKTIAEINGEPIMLDDIDILIEPQLYYHLSNMYTERSATLDRLIEQKILQVEASKHHLTYDTFLDSLYRNNSYLQQVKHLSDSDFYLKKGKNYQINRIERLIRKHWVDSLSSLYQVKKYLNPPQRNYFVDMTGIKSQIKGNPTALLTMWIVSDYDCYSCKQMQPVYDSVYAKYKDKIRYAAVFFSEEVTPASIAAECAALQGKYWEMQKKLYQCNKPGDLKLYTRVADSLRLDTIQFKRDFNNPAIYDNISKNMELLHERKVFGTPTIVIGTKMYMDVQSTRQLSQLIDKQLMK